MGLTGHKMKSTGYSGSPLSKKLGLKSGFKVRLINQPEHYFDLFEDWPEQIEISDVVNFKKNLIHFFAIDLQVLENDLPALKEEIQPNGMIWISWPKKASKIATDINEDIIRKLALAIGLVDIKVCAVDQVWSGLKLVIPVKDRAKLC